MFCFRDLYVAPMELQKKAERMIITTDITLLRSFPSLHRVPTIPKVPVVPFTVINHI